MLMAYSKEQIAAHKANICERIAQGESLRAICRGEDAPAASTVFLWLSEDATFSEQYARAREAQADALFDEMLDIADDGRNDWMERIGKDEQPLGWQLNGEAVRRSQIRIDARKWMASKLQPKKYGDKIDVNHSGSIQTMSEEQVDARLAELLGKAGAGAASGAQGTPEGDEQA